MQPLDDPNVNEFTYTRIIVPAGTTAPVRRVTTERDVLIYDTKGSVPATAFAQGMIPGKQYRIKIQYPESNFGYLFLRSDVGGNWVFTLDPNLATSNEEFTFINSIKSKTKVDSPNLTLRSLVTTSQAGGPMLTINARASPEEGNFQSGKVSQVWRVESLQNVDQSIVESMSVVSPITAPQQVPPSPVPLTTAQAREERMRALEVSQIVNRPDWKAEIESRAKASPLFESNIEAAFSVAKVAVLAIISDMLKSGLTPGQIVPSAVTPITISSPMEVITTTPQVIPRERIQETIERRRREIRETRKGEIPTSLPFTAKTGKKIYLDYDYEEIPMKVDVVRVVEIPGSVGPSIEDGVYIYSIPALVNFGKPEEQKVSLPITAEEFASLSKDIAQAYYRETGINPINAINFDPDPSNIQRRISYEGTFTRAPKPFTEEEEPETEEEMEVEEKAEEEELEIEEKILTSPKPAPTRKPKTYTAFGIYRNKVKEAVRPLSEKEALANPQEADRRRGIWNQIVAWYLRNNPSGATSEDISKRKSKALAQVYAYYAKFQWDNTQIVPEQDKEKYEQEAAAKNQAKEVAQVYKTKKTPKPVQKRPRAPTPSPPQRIPSPIPSPKPRVRTPSPSPSPPPPKQTKKSEQLSFLDTHIEQIKEERRRRELSTLAQVAEEELKRTPSIQQIKSSISPSRLEQATKVLKSAFNEP